MSAREQAIDGLVIDGYALLARMARVLKSATRHPEGLVVLIGAAVLIGWALDVRPLTRLYLGPPGMKANAAVAFILAGLAAWLLRPATTARSRSVLGCVCAGATLLIGLLSVVEHALGSSLGVDELLFRDSNPVAGTAPGRMALNAAVTFVVVGAALLLLRAPWAGRARMVEALGVVVGAIGFLALIGKLYAVRSIESGFAGRLTPIAVSAAVAATLLAPAVLAVWPRGRLMALATSAGPGGVLIRRLVVPAVGVMLLLGLFRLEAERHSALGGRTATALYVFLGAVTAAVLVVAVARVLDRADAERQRAYRRVEEVLRRSRASERRFHGLLESSPDAVVIAGVDGRMVFVNHLAQELLGYQRRELIGKPVELLLPEAERVAHAALRDRFVADGRRRTMGGGLVLAARRKDGGVLPVEIGLGPVESDGEVLVIATLRDVSARLEAEAALAKAERERRNLLERLINVEEEERQRIAADIHDDSVQVLAALALRLDWVAGRIDDPELADQVEEVGETARASLARLRHLTFELYPPSLDDDGLAAVLQRHVDALRSRSGVDFTLDVEVSREPDTQTGIIVYRIVQEALANVVKHAGARRVRIDLSATEAGVTAQVADDGVGMASDRASRPEPGHLGLRAMRERAEMAGGWWRIESTLGTGTRIEFFVPAGSS